jgi:hypothetical protein
LVEKTKEETNERVAMIEADFDSKIAQTVEKNRVLEEKIQFLEESSSKKLLALEDRLQT